MFPACLLLLLSFAFASATNTSNVNINILAPTAVKVGENAVLQCEYDLEKVPEDKIAFKWWFISDSPPSRSLLYQKIRNNPAQNLRPNKIVVKGNDTIEILNATTKDTGTYLCDVSEDLGIPELKKTHHLTVFSPGTGPQLNITKVENETGVLVTCRADDVAPYPVLVISIDGEEIRANDSMVNYNNASDDWSIETNVTTDDETVSFKARCELFYEDNNVIHEPYAASELYNGSGVESTTAEDVVATTEETLSTTLPTDGSPLLHFSWLALLVAPLLQALVAL